MSLPVVCCLVSELYPTLLWPHGCRLPGSSVYGISQARILEWVAIPFSRGCSWPRDQTPVPCVSCIGRWILYHWATWEAPTVAQEHPYYTADLWKIQTWIHRSTYTPFFFFPVGNTTWSRFHNPGLVESACAKEPWIKRADCELPAGFPLCRKSVPLTPHCSRVNCTWGLRLWF